MITRIVTRVTVLGQPLDVHIRLCGVGIYRRERDRQWPADKIWVLGLLVYCSRVEYKP